MRRSLPAGVVLAASLVSGCGAAPEPAPPETDRVVGVKIYETEREPAELFAEWNDLGINTVFASEALASSDGFRELAEERGARLFVIFPVFYSPEDLAEDPDLWAVTATGERAKEEWVEFACPSRAEFRGKRVDQARSIVERLRPDGLSIDFIRHFVFWEMVGPDRDPATLPDTCYCPVCLEGFAEFSGTDPAVIPMTAADAAAWIRDNAHDAWVRFKCATITSMAAEIAGVAREVDPDIAVNLHIVPWRKSDYDGSLARVAGQDISALGAVADFLSPMTYSFMLHRLPEWVGSVVKDLDASAICPVLPSIQVAPAYREDAVFSGAEFEVALRSALEPPSAGVVFWSWDHIEADPEKAAVIQKVTGERG
jgi:hypothetical protein